MQVPARLAAVLVCLAALVASGCGAGGSASAQTAKLLADTFGAAQPVRSGRLDLTLDVRARRLPNRGRSRSSGRPWRGRAQACADLVGQ